MKTGHIEEVGFDSLINFYTHTHIYIYIYCVYILCIYTVYIIYILSYIQHDAYNFCTVRWHELTPALTFYLLQGSSQQLTVVSLCLYMCCEKRMRIRMDKDSIRIVRPKNVETQWALGSLGLGGPGTLSLMAISGTGVTRWLSTNFSLAAAGPSGGAVHRWADGLTLQDIVVERPHIQGHIPWDREVSGQVIANRFPAQPFDYFQLIGGCTGWPLEYIS